MIPDLDIAAIKIDDSEFTFIFKAESRGFQKKGFVVLPNIWKDQQ